MNGNFLPICRSAFSILLFAAGAGLAQSPGTQTDAQAATSHVDSTGTHRTKSSASPYLESPTPYQHTAPSGCVGCVATPAEARALSAQRQDGVPAIADAGQVFGDSSPLLPGASAAADGPRRVGSRQSLPNPLPYDLLIHGGHVIDVKNGVDRVTDVAVKDGKIAAVGDDLKSTDAAKTIDAKVLYVIPGMIDIHMHMYATTGEAESYAGDNGIWPDGFTLRSGVTTAVDAGSSGWRNFEDFKEHVIDRSQTRVLAMLNIVGAGMRGGLFEDNLADMNAEPTAWIAKRYPGVVVGIKSAHFTGPGWDPYIQAVKAGTSANVPVMIDYGANRIERPLFDLLTKYLRSGDIYTHTYSGLRGEQNTHTLTASAALVEGRKRGIYFDAGTGGGSFRFRVAYPLIQAGFKPDSLSTDLHIDSMNSSTKDMLNVMSKFMAMGLSLKEVVADTTWNPAQEIKQEQLGNLSVGAPADIAVLREEQGSFAYLDMDNMKLMGDTRLICELTVRSGKIVFDLNGLSMDVWNGKQTSDPRVAAHWTTFVPRPPLPEQLIPSEK
jgi:dihydroorotase